MARRTVAVLILFLLILNLLVFAYRVHEVRASSTIHIRANGLVEGTTKISSIDNVTYAFLANINDSIVVERSGIVLDGGGFVLQGSASGIGLELANVSNVEIKSLTIRDYEFGVQVISSFLVTITKNLVEANQQGISMNYSSNNTISGNTIKDNTFAGILMSNCGGNIIRCNTIMHNYYGVHLQTVADSHFLHNNFMNNVHAQAYIAPGITGIWDGGFLSGGNYWSDYFGPDVNGDLRGDVAYAVNPSNHDNYPFVEPWSADEDSIVIGTTTKVDSIDPAGAYGNGAWEVLSNIGEGLMKYRPGTSDLVFGLAENYTVSPDGLNYTFELKRNMHFTDGNLLDAAAVKWSIDRVSRLGLAPAYMVSDVVDRVEVIDSFSVRFVLKKAVSFFPAITATQPYTTVSPISYPLDHTGNPIIGQYGPYRIKSWTNGSELVLESNTKYIGAQPRAKNIIVRYFSSSAVVRIALENRDIDVALNLNTEDVVGLKSNSSSHFNFGFFENHDSYTRYLIMRCNMTPFDNVNVRQAIAAAIDRDRICTNVFLGTADPLFSVVGMGMWSHTDAFLNEYGVRNVTLARELLTAAEYSEEHKLQFDFWYAENPIQLAVATTIKSSLEETSMITVTLRNSTGADFSENIPKGIMPMFWFGWIPDYLDPDAYLTPILYSTNSPNYGLFYGNSSLDAILEEASSERNITRRGELYESAQTMLAQDVPLVPFAQGTFNAFAQPDVQGIYLPSTGLVPYYTMYRVTRSTRYSWPMFRQNLDHTGYTESPTPNTNHTQWMYKTGGDNFSSPIVAYGRVYIGSSYDGRVYCLDAYTGASVWNYTVGSWMVSSPAVADGKVYIGSYSYDGKVYCLDAYTGALIWSHMIGDYVVSSPAVAYGKIYVGSWDHHVYCLDAFTGAHVWNFTTGDLVFSSAAIVDGRVYVGSYDGKVYCLDAYTGALVWSRTIGSYVFSSPAVADGKVYVGSGNHKICCLNSSTGSSIWNYTTNDVVISSPAVAYGRVYVGSYDTNVYCLDAATGARQWNFTTGYWVFSSPAVADGKVYIDSDVGKVYCLDAYTGTNIWNYATGDVVVSSPAVADGMVYVGSYNGCIYGFGNVIKVPEDYKTIQAAIDAAVPGSTIWIAPGIYHECLVINKTLTILGELGSTPIFDGGGSGIAVTLLSSASGSTIAGITITNYKQGVLVVDSSNCKVYDDIMTLMKYSGIALDGANAVHNTISDNIFKDSSIAIDLVESSTDNNVCRNIISSNDVGLHLETNGNTIWANTIYDNKIAVNVSGSSGNTIYMNNFINNDAQVICVSSSNYWYQTYPVGGNFWSSYSGPDILSGSDQDQPGGDGKIDVPYVIATNNVDRYPLTGPYNPVDIGISMADVSKTVVGLGYIVRVHVNIVNFGVYDESFTVTVFVNTTLVAQKPISLVRGSYIGVSLEWHVVGFAKGNYTISTQITVLQGEAFVTNNEYTAGHVKVTIPGDVDGDKDVDILDVVKITGVYASKLGDTIFKPNSDIDSDDRITILDVVVCTGHYGQKDP